MPSALASFFFLAEDGIRDRNVTGVQTCALPISSAMADIWVPLRAGSDIIFLGGMINYVLANNKEFREYVVNYTNAATLLRDDFKDTEDLDGLFSGWDAEKKQYDPESWLYRGAPVKG